ncbi:hypothetical protein BST61_g638 [Cercospora zeina]
MPYTNGQSLKAHNDSGKEALSIPRHRMRNLLENGKSVIGCFQSFAGAWAARIVASCGWDSTDCNQSKALIELPRQYVIIDCEHGNHDDADMHDCVNAVAAEGVSPIVRLQSQDGGLIKRALDAGSHGMMIPMVNTAEQARQIVQRPKFPPMGARGQGSSFCAIGFRHFSRRIETPEAVAHADEIASIPGIDGLFIGPNDLALSMLGYVPATWKEPEFLVALDAVEQVCRKHGKYSGVLSRNAEHAKELLERFDVVGSDVPVTVTTM